VPQKSSAPAVPHTSLSLPASHASTAEAQVSLAEEQQCAVSLVNELLGRAGLARMLDPQTLKVIIGEGNWISFSFQMHRGADHSSLDVSKTLRRTAGKAQEGKSTKSVWFRGEGAPSLHFEVIPAERLGEILVQGHVDAADPKGHPAAHFFRDFLPSHGLGTHPTPSKLLATLPAEPK
jgi:hypothetical protein